MVGEKWDLTNKKCGFKGNYSCIMIANGILMVFNIYYIYMTLGGFGWRKPDQNGDFMGYLWDIHNGICELRICTL